MTPRGAAEIPQRVGKYEILLPLASGGMGKVYLARVRGHGGFETEVALKVTHPHLRESAEFAEQLLEEAKLAVRIRHRNVVSTLDVGDDPLGLYLVMEYVEGDTLSGLRKRAKAAGKSIPVGIIVRILLDSLAGLHAAHELVDEDSGEKLDVVHRDFTPSNILVGSDGVARLTDFGIAKAASRVGNTATGVMKGKIPYMSPQQARGDKVDRRADVWAAGVIAWEIFADRRLYPSGDDVATLLKIVTEPVPKLMTARPGIPQSISDVVSRALEHDPAKRYPTAIAFSRDLAAACRKDGEVAEPEEVEACMRDLLAPLLAERKDQLGKVRRLRAEMGRIAERAEAGATEPKSDPAVAARVSSVRLPAAPPAGGPLTTVTAPMAVPAGIESSTTDVDAPTTGMTDATSTTDPHGPSSVVPRPLSPFLLPAVVAGAVIVAIATGFGLMAATRDPKKDTLNPADSALATTTTATPDPTPTPTPQPASPPDAGSPAAPAATTAATAVTASPPPPRPQPLPHAPPPVAAPPPPPKPTLAPIPFPQPAPKPSAKPASTSLAPSPYH